MDTDSEPCIKKQRLLIKLQMLTVVLDNLYLVFYLRYTIQSNVVSITVFALQVHILHYIVSINDEIVLDCSQFDSSLSRTALSQGKSKYLNVKKWLVTLYLYLLAKTFEL